MKCEAVAMSAPFMQSRSSRRVALSVPSAFSKNEKAFLHIFIVTLSHSVFVAEIR